MIQSVYIGIVYIPCKTMPMLFRLYGYTKTVFQACGCMKKLAHGENRHAHRGRVTPPNTPQKQKDHPYQSQDSLKTVSRQSQIASYCPYHVAAHIYCQQRLF